MLIPRRQQSREARERWEIGEERGMGRGNHARVDITRVSPSVRLLIGTFAALLGGRSSIRLARHDTGPCPPRAGVIALPIALRQTQVCVWGVCVGGGGDLKNGREHG